MHALFAWPAVLALTAAFFAAAAFTGLFARDLRAHWHAWSASWARWALWIAGVQVDVKNRMRMQRLMARGPVILACNHQSMMDIAILLAHVPGAFGFLSKIEVFKIPLFGAAAELFGCIPLKRGDRSSASQALDAAAAALLEGRSVLIFPEGTRTRDGALARFKRGTMLLSARTGVPVLPLAIGGSYELLPRHTFIAKRGTVTLAAGPLMVPPHPSEVEASSVELHDAVQGLLPTPFEHQGVRHDHRPRSAEEGREADPGSEPALEGAEHGVLAG